MVGHPHGRSRDPVGGLRRARGHPRIALDVDVENAAARALYERLGYREVGIPPRRAYGTILLRGKPFSFDVMFGIRLHVPIMLFGNDVVVSGCSTVFIGG